MYTCAVRPEIASLSAYVPGMSIAEVRERYGLSRVIKMASNENPLGVSPLVRKVLATSLEEAFRYPQGGNPALREALARAHHVSPERIVVGNGSDEIIDMLIRMLAVPGKHSVVCFEPCFSLYPIQARICGVEPRKMCFIWQQHCRCFEKQGLKALLADLKNSRHCLEEEWESGVHGGDFLLFFWYCLHFFMRMSYYFNKNF